MKFWMIFLMMLKQVIHQIQILIILLFEKINFVFKIILIYIMIIFINDYVIYYKFKIINFLILILIIYEINK